ncbi:dihydrofolate reductase family protein [Crocinitomix catalasitica]|uniref:dihydrofolate reductase family protein n=1 Tax=Crocinitomix catalasitica TaxID=184607 RepID=UPI000B10B6D7|nr:dihydrofolate reductase family protein [Crocinitomix catalasitica]
MQGDGVEKYQADLLSFDTVIMGRKTYEFGFKYGLEPGQPAYPNMQHYFFSNSLKIDNLSESVHIEQVKLDRIDEIQKNATTDIYLCGGGQFAGWLLENGKIDQLKLKLNPVVLGKGIKLFGKSTAIENWELIKTETYNDGLQIVTYNKKK